MTYTINRIIDFTFKETHYTAELKLTICEDEVYVGDNPIPDRKTYIESIQPIEITTNEPRRVIFPKVENKWLTLPEDLRVKIEEEILCVDLSEDQD